MENLIKEIVSAIEDKKGKDIVSLDLSGFDGAICSAFVVCSADSTTQVEAIADNIEYELKNKLNERPRRIEGMNNAVWVVMDYFEVMVHIFLQETRDYYKLEQMWADAPVTKYEYDL